MAVKILKAIQLGLEMVAAMPVHSVVYHLLHGIPVWIEVGLAVVAFALLMALVSTLRRGDEQKGGRKAREVIVIKPGGSVNKVAVDDNDIVVVQSSPPKPKKAKSTTSTK